MKKTTVLFLVLSYLLTLTLPCYAADASPIEPRYTNAQSASVIMTISSTGNATVSVRCAGKDLTKATVVTYIQKNINGSWVRVASWNYSTTSNYISKTYSTTLAGSGAYRAVAVFTLTASSTETITETYSASY